MQSRQRKAVKGSMRFLRDRKHLWVAIGLAVLCAPLIVGLSDELHGDAKPGGSLVQDSAVQSDSREIRIGVLAKRGREWCLEKWGPTARYLTDRIPGHSFSIVPLGFEDIYPAVKRDELDFILANPSFYVGLEALHGATRIVTLKNLRLGKPCMVFGGVIFHRADRTDIERLNDLRGKTFMAVEEASLGGWLAVWRELKEMGIDPHRDFAELKFGGTHDAVVYAVRDGVVDAGSVRTDTLERMAQEGKIRLEDYRVIQAYNDEHGHLPFLHSTRPYPEWPLAKLPHVSGQLAEKLAVTLMIMPADSPAARAARCAGWTIPLNYQPVHDCLKELRAYPYEDYGEVSISDIMRQYWPWLLAFAVLGALASLLAFRMRRFNQELHAAAAAREEEIAERKRAEEALLKSETKFRTLYDSSSDAVMLLNEKGFFDCNAATLRIFGCASRDEF